ncbi:MAG: DNA adenine methylase [Planctomycetota bacterium]|nr:DNA adenine methylase [Planctomycetota bacterium]
MTVPETPMRTLWYMGAKTRLCEEFIDGAVRDLISPGETLLDACSGTGAVGRWFAGDYRVLANDAQYFSSVIASAHLEVEADWFSALDLIEPETDLAQIRDKNFSELEKLFGSSIELERRFLKEINTASTENSDLFEQYRQFCDLMPVPFSDPQSLPEGVLDPFSDIRGELPRLLNSCRSGSRFTPAMMCTVYWGQVYFSIEQSIMIDSIRCAIEAIPESSAHHKQKKALYLSALLHAVSVSTSGTSHFAQPRSVEKDNELLAVVKRRSTDIPEQFELALDAIRKEVLERPRLSGNKVFCHDILELLAEGNALEDENVDLVYLDPPYTSDNYSRFYHVLETLARYDYPDLQLRGEELTKGRYPVREMRFTSEFCSGPHVEDAFRKVAEGCKKKGAKLLISYSGDTGLLTKRWLEQGHPNPAARLRELLLEYFATVEIREQKLMHSGQGDSNRPVQELLLLCED